MWSKTDIKEYDNKDKFSTISNFFVPNGVELAFYFFISFVVLAVLNLEVFWNLINGRGTTVSAKEVINDQLANYDYYLRSDALGKATSFVVWGFIGSIAYMGVWVVQHFFIRVKRDVEESEYASNKESKGGYWESRVAQFVILVASAFSLIAAVVGLFYFVPLAGSLAGAVLQHPSQVSSYVYLILGLILGVLIQYVFIRVWRIFKFSFGIFFSGTEED